MTSSFSFLEFLDPKILNANSITLLYIDSYFRTTLHFCELDSLKSFIKKNSFAFIPTNYFIMFHKIIDQGFENSQVQDFSTENRDFPERLDFLNMANTAYKIEMRISTYPGSLLQTIRRMYSSN
jgi:hypothetical protein